MKTKTFATPAAAKKFRAAMAARGYRVSPVQQRGCIARGITFYVQFSA